MKRRLPYVDACKGFGILLVVMGHAAVPEPLKDWIYSFHMPLFFLLSGYVARPSGGSLRKELKQTAGRLLYPYFLIGGGITLYLTVLDVLKAGAMDWTKLAKRLTALGYSNVLWENNYDYIGTLWFLTALFCVEAIYLTLKRFGSGRRPAVLIILAGAGGFLVDAGVKAAGIRLPFCLDTALPALLFYAAGAALKRLETRRFLSFPPIGLLLIVGGTAAGALNTAVMRRAGKTAFQVNLLGMDYGSRPLYLLAAVCLSAGFLLLCKAAGRKSKLSLLREIGRNSLWIMALHIYIMAVVRAGLGAFGMKNVWVIVLVTILLSDLCARMVRRYLPWLYTKPKTGLRAGERTKERWQRSV